MRTHFFKHVSSGLAHVLGGLLMVAGFGAIVMLLWNLAIPAIFGLTAINFWQALILLILSRILVGGLGGKFRHNAGAHHHFNPIHEKWLKMTPEEKQEFIKNKSCRGHRGHFQRDFFNANDFDFGKEPKKDEAN